KKCQVFLNDTKVIKARIFGEKTTGGKVEVFLNKPLPNSLFLVLIRGKVAVGTKITFGANTYAIVQALHDDGTRTVSFWQGEKLLDFQNLIDILEQIGHVPLPPYIQRQDTIQDETNYQTLFAKETGAVAAPTASLHFTPQLLQKLKERHSTFTLTLHVGAGTFKPVDTDIITNHPMHTERFYIPHEAIEAIETKAPILAIGTTVTRTIEYYARTKISSGECNLFLHPHNKPLRVNHLLTNFHLPKSTLIMLVSSFIGREETLRLYDIAIKKNYRFFSYGDGMLIL
ncbi:MAG TPA: tRNA preQ1(34) S-adenosylmethionine ribosyltransferase-isomerase QueA, partial [Epsilonproteobacteria bacterium]|nr:tRNA preQ1(34) S-adenosylmethionine ribosyltransferase-isomerase QueA [Campylobacterota bacterium]